MNETRTVPKRVLETLELVRESGMVNMFDRNGVIVVSDVFDHWSYEWLMFYCGNYKRGSKLVDSWSNVFTQFNNYLKRQNEINNSKSW